MMIKLVAIFILVVIASIADALNEALKHNFNSVASKINRIRSNPNFWNPAISHINKWKLDGNGRIVYKDGKRVERYFGSSTFLVMFTDAYHRLRHINKLSVFVAVVLSFTVNFGFVSLMFVIYVAILFAAFYLTFHFLYNYLTKKK